MINVSNEWKTVIDGDNRNFSFTLNFTFADSTTLTINNKSELIAPGLSYDAAISGDSSLDIGTAIISSLEITLNNSNGAYNSYDFTGASVAVYISLQLSNSTETILQGVYYVDSVEDVNVTKTIICLDALSLLDVDYTPGTYPQTITAAVSEACTAGSVTFAGTIPAGSETVTNTPESGFVCRDIVSAAAGASGGYAYADENGEIRIGTFKAVSGANTDKAVTKLIRRTKADTDITVTGVMFQVEETDYQAGASGYCLVVSDNPLVDAGNAQSVASTAWATLQNVAGVRSCEITIPLDPATRCGDLLHITDGTDSYYCYVLALKWNLNGAMRVICKLASAKEQKSDKSNTTRVLIKTLAKEKAEEVVGSYDVAVTGLNALAINSLGYYETREQQPDGSYIYYAHDEPTLAGSTNIFKRTAAGFFWSEDGGVTYTSGLTSTGCIVAKMLDVIGINANWIQAGSITASKIDIADLFAQTITASDLTITGGAVNITTASDSDDKIKLNNVNGVITSEFWATPKGFASKATDSNTGEFGVVNSTVSPTTANLTVQSQGSGVVKTSSLSNGGLTMTSGGYTCSLNYSNWYVYISGTARFNCAFQVDGAATFSNTLTASGAKHFSNYTYLTSDDKMFADGVNQRIQGTDENDNVFSIFNAGADLWFGAAHGSANQHDGAVYISTGWDVSTGAPNAPYIHTFIPSSLTSGTAYETPNKGTCPWGRGSVTIAGGATYGITVTNPTALVGGNPVCIVTPNNPNVVIYNLTNASGGGTTNTVIVLKNNSASNITCDVNYLILRSTN